MHMCYAFEFLAQTVPTGRRIADVLTRFYSVASEGWACWAFSNHDCERHASRWGMSQPQLQVYLAVLLSMRGSVCLYQGEELGLPEAQLSFEDLRDPYGIRFWPKFRGRDGCRTPMPWAKDNSYGGFSTEKPWLPLPANHLERAVAGQDADPASLLAFYRRMLAFRRTVPALAKGGFELIGAGPEEIAFRRDHEGRSVLCAFNLGAAPRRIALPAGVWRPIARAPFAATVEGSEAVLPPCNALFAERG
jgi:alpha-glucosidase